MRDGPSRLISTAESSGESNDTAAAEWMMMSHDAQMARSASFRPRPSRVTSPATVVIRPATAVSKSAPCICAQPVEGVVLEDLLAGPLGGGGALAVADQQHEFAVGHAAQQSLDERGADEPGAMPVMAIRFPDSDAAITVDSSSTFVYQLVER